MAQNRLVLGNDFLPSAIEKESISEGYLETSSIQKSGIRPKVLPRRSWHHANRYSRTLLPSKDSDSDRSKSSNASSGDVASISTLCPGGWTNSGIATAAN